MCIKQPLKCRQFLFIFRLGTDRHSLSLSPYESIDVPLFLFEYKHVTLCL